MSEGEDGWHVPHWGCLFHRTPFEGVVNESERMACDPRDGPCFLLRIPAESREEVS